MAKSKLKTPDWILEGYDSEEMYLKKKGKKVPKKTDGKTFKVRECPKCSSDQVSVVVGKERRGEWECRKCKWIGREIKEDELSEDEFMGYLDKKHIDLPSDDEFKSDFKKVIEGDEEE